MQQDVLFANGLEDIAALLENLGWPGTNGGNLRSGRSHRSGICIRRTRFHDARCGGRDRLG